VRMAWLMTVVLLLATLVAGCTGAAADPPAGQPFISGSITQIDKNRILVEEIPGKQEGNKCWLAVGESSRVLRAAGTGYTAAAFGDLKVGQKVNAWVSGPVLESYPCQGGADAVLIR